MDWELNCSDEGVAPVCCDQGGAEQKDKAFHCSMYISTLTYDHDHDNPGYKQRKLASPQGHQGSALDIVRGALLSRGSSVESHCSSDLNGDSCDGLDILGSLALEVFVHLLLRGDS